MNFSTVIDRLFDGTSRIGNDACDLTNRNKENIASAVAHIMDTAAFCDLVMQDTGKCIRLALEPEPGCFLEQTIC